jgi:hypothetical protein
LREADCYFLFNAFLREKIDNKIIKTLTVEDLRALKIGQNSISIGVQQRILRTIKAYYSYENYFFDELKPKCIECAEEAKKISERIQ